MICTHPSLFHSTSLVSPFVRTTSFSIWNAVSSWPPHMVRLTWSPLYNQLAKYKLHSWSSKGNLFMSTRHVVRSCSGVIQNRWPEATADTIVSIRDKSPSTLKTKLENASTDTGQKSKDRKWRFAYQIFLLWIFMDFVRICVKY